MKLNEIRADALKKLEAIHAKSERDLAALKTYLFGKAGVLTGLMKSLKDLPPEEKPQAGKEINDLRVELVAKCDEKEKELHRLAIEAELDSESIDLSIDKPLHAVGARHPLNQVRKRLTDYFIGNGYIVYDSPEIETDYYNFQALNVPQDHPARDMQDTFFINDNILLRTQTSSGQIRLMEKFKPPIKMICPGRVFRNDDDSTHSPVFHQMEGLVVDKNVTLCDLKGTLEGFAKFIFGDGCRVCKNTGWIEILGAGMVNRRVLENCGIDPDEYRGFAFGMGLDRITMIQCAINDIKLLWENDVRFLHMFK